MEKYSTGLFDELNAAITSHGLWSKTLTLAVRMGKLVIPIETFESDRECDFGKWLYRDSFDNEHNGFPPLSERSKDSC